MDLATIIGIVGGLILQLAVMQMAGSMLMFWDLLSVICVIGGAFFSVMMRWPMKGFINGLAGSSQALKDAVSDPKELIDEIVEAANVARKGSILALEKVPFANVALAKYIRMLVDGRDIVAINQIIDIDIEITKQRNKDSRGVLENMGEACPAFGMIGTVIGLIVIMANLTDPSAIGPGLAVALITTLYGSLIANMVFIPLAQKIKLRGTAEMLNFNIIRGGLNSLVAGENPRAMREKLESYLDDAPEQKQAA
jgi:chemotaxis protein MotA